MSGALDGIRVVDLTTVMLGPLATQTLGDMGADVIKVESPSGDIARQVTPFRRQGMGSMFLNANRNKRSLAIDLKKPRGLAALESIIDRADVFVHNMRGDAADRLGLGYEALASRNPRLIYCAAYGFSQAGPYKGRAAYDDVIQAACGLAFLQGYGEESPRYVNSIVADKVVALTLVYSVAMALFHRERSGCGQFIEVPMFETMVAFLLPEHLCGRSFEPNRGDCGYSRVLNEHRRPYRTKDGFIAVLPYTSDQVRAFFQAAERYDLAEDARFSTPQARLTHVREYYGQISDLVRLRTTAEWQRLLDGADVPCFPVRSPDDLLSDPHLLELGFFPLIDQGSEGQLRTIGIPVRFSATPGSIRRPPPRLGEHNVEILAEAGLTQDEIGSLSASETISVAKHEYVAI